MINLLFKYNKVIVYILMIWIFLKHFIIIIYKSKNLMIIIID